MNMKKLSRRLLSVMLVIALMMQLAAPAAIAAAQELPPEAGVQIENMIDGKQNDDEEPPGADDPVENPIHEEDSSEVEPPSESEGTVENPVDEELQLEEDEGIEEAIDEDNPFRPIDDEVILTELPRAYPRVTASGQPIPERLERMSAAASTDLLLDDDNPFFSGSGTESSPYVITTPEAFWHMRHDLSAHYRLARDIDMTGYPWLAIGDEQNPFTGSLDGNGRMVTNLYIYSSEDYTGLFGYIDGARIENLTLKEATVLGEKYTGAVSGYAVDSILENISVADSLITGDDYTGGISGWIYGGTATELESNSWIDSYSGSSYTGGISGYLNGAVTYSFFTGAVHNFGNYCGGIVGFLEAGDVEYCTNTGDVTGGLHVGGLIGQAKYEETGYKYVRYNYNGGSVDGVQFVGGIGGSISTPQSIHTGGSQIGMLSNANHGQIKASSTRAGGLVGSVIGNLSSMYNYNNGLIEADGFMGGLFGVFNEEMWFTGSIINSYNAGDFNYESGSIVGSVVGYSYVSLMTRCYYLREDRPGGIGFNASSSTFATPIAIDAAGLKGLIPTLGIDRFKEDSKNINDGFPILIDVDYSPTKKDYEGITWEDLYNTGKDRFEDGLTELSADPVDLSTGNFYETRVDISIEGAFPIKFTRTYNSIDSFDGALGHNWHHGFEQSVTFGDDGELYITFEDGHVERYTPDGAGGYTAPAGKNKVLRQTTSGYTLTLSNQSYYEISAEGFVTGYFDPNGNKTDYQYENGKLIRVSTLSGSISLAYGADGFISSATDSAGNAVQYEYADGNLTKVTGLTGDTAEYRYDDEGRLLSYVDPAGSIMVINVYDEEYRVTSQSFPDSGRMTYDYSDIRTTLTDQLDHITIYYLDEQKRIYETEYYNGSEKKVFDDSNKMILYTDRNQNSWHFEYDVNGNLLKETGPLGAVKSYQYNDQNQVVQVTTARGGVHNFTYDAKGNEILTKDALGNEISYSYNARGLKESATDPQGSTVYMTYDDRGNLAAKTDALGNTTHYEYDSLNRLTKVTAPGGGIETYTYTPTGQIASYTDAGGKVTYYQYNENDLIAAQVDADGIGSRYTYNSMQKLASQTNELGYTITYDYDQAWNLIRINHPDGTSEGYDYDAGGLLTAATDRSGNVTRYAYDGEGNMVSMTDSLGFESKYTYDALSNVSGLTAQDGATMSYTYDPEGNLISETDYLGNVTHYEYDLLGRCTSITDALGGVTSYTYDANGNVITEKNAAGHELKYDYDERNMLNAVVLPNGGRIAYEYDQDGNMIKTTDPLGAVTVYEYDALGQAVSVTDHLGNKTEVEYDKNGNTTKIKDPLGNETQYAYDAKGRLVKTVNANGNTEEVSYSDNGYIAAMTNAAGGSTRYEYDAVGNLLAVTDANGNTTRYEYDSKNQMTAEIDPLERRTKYAYDSRGNMVESTDPKGNVTRYAYNADGSVAAVTDALGNTTSYKYNALGAVTEITDARGGMMKMEYDKIGNLLSITDALGRSTTFVYDAHGNATEIYNPLGVLVEKNTYDLNDSLIQTEDALGNTKKYTYDSLMQLVESIDALNNKTTYQYDGQGQTISVTDAMGGTIQFAYDAVGNLISATDQNGNTTTYRYNSLGYVTEQDSGTGGTIKRSYNAAGQVISWINGRGTELALSYDAAGQLTEFGSTAYTYDANGNILTTANEAGTTTRTYDALNRVTSFTDVNGNTIGYEYDACSNLTSLAYPDGSVVKYTYDAANQLTQVEDYSGRVTKYTYDGAGRLAQTDYPNGVEETRTYDDKGQLRFVSSHKDGSSIDFWSYTFDANGNLVRDSGQYTGSNNTYDANGRLLTAKYTTGGDYTYSYDAAGNILSIAGDNSRNMSYGLANMMTAVGGSLVSYDADGNMTHGPIDGVWTDLSYSPRNELTKAGEVQYVYDGEGTRVSAGSRVFVTDPVAELSRILMMMDDSGTTKYVYGLNGLISQENGAGEYRIFHFDYRGSTSALSDETGMINDIFMYDAYGVLDYQFSSNETIFTYVGQYGVVTDDNGLYYMRARYYEPESGRFISLDPIQSDVNWYAYANSNPMSNIDPQGLQAKNAAYIQMVDTVEGLDVLNALAAGNVSDAMSTIAKSNGARNGYVEWGAFVTLNDEDDSIEDFMLYIKEPDADVLYQVDDIGCLTPNVVYDPDTGRYIYYWGETGTPNIHYAVKDAKDPREVASSVSDQDRAELAVDDELWEQAYWTIMYQLELAMLELYTSLAWNTLFTAWGMFSLAGAGYIGSISTAISIVTLEHDIIQLAALQHIMNSDPEYLLDNPKLLETPIFFSVLGDIGDALTIIQVVSNYSKLFSGVKPTELVPGFDFN